MHACDLVELAALISTEGPLRIDRGQLLPSASLQQYWGASKCRLDRWSARLKTCRQRLADTWAAEPSVSDSVLRIALPICREVLASEVLTRLWTAWSAAYDRRLRLPEAEPVARSVWIGHLDARRRVLDFMSSTAEIPHRDAAGLDRLRRASERWTDLLLAPFAARCDVSDLAHDPDRLADFADEIGDSAFFSATGISPAIRASSLQATYPVGDGYATWNTDLNAEIAGAILTCFEPDWATVPLESPPFWAARLMAIFDEAQRSLDGLLSIRPE